MKNKEYTYDYKIDFQSRTTATIILKGVKENNIPLKNPDVTLFMIIELVSSTCFNSILYGEPLPIDEYKPILYDTIKKLINNN